MAFCSSCCQHLSLAGLRGCAAVSRCTGVERAAGVQVVAGRSLQLRERHRMVVYGEENAGSYKSQSLHRRWRHGAFGGSVTVSADALAAQLEEERAGNPCEAPVILEVQGLRAVVADTR
jgi:hypothetical protein